MYAMNIQNDVIGLVLRENCKSKQVTVRVKKKQRKIKINKQKGNKQTKINKKIIYMTVCLKFKRIPSVFMYAMNIQNDVIGLVLRENCKSKQVTDFIAWPSRCHDTILSP
jgi:hypothetical protein